MVSVCLGYYLCSVEAVVCPFLPPLDGKFECSV